MLDKAAGLLRRAGKKLNITYKQSQSNHLLWMTVFVFAILFALYFIHKLLRVFLWIFGS